MPFICLCFTTQTLLIFLCKHTLTCGFIWGYNFLADFPAVFAVEVPAVLFTQNMTRAGKLIQL